ncbi:MAG: serine hydrolase, partial [Caulobacteraceae bacterium]|nr:serine hydrolase [Caulobacteraceae bacterium]
MRLNRRHFVASSAASLWTAACTRQQTMHAPPTFADPGRLSQGARALNVRARPGLMNMGVMDLDQERVWYADDLGHYPLASLANLLTATCALSQIDGQKMRLNERLRIDRDGLSPPPSRVNEQFARDGGPLDLPLADLIGLAIQHDDNTAADAVLKRVGGPTAVTAWLGEKGFKGLRLDSYARQRIPEMFGLGDFRAEWADERGFAHALEGIEPAMREEAMDRYLADSRDTATVPGMIDFLDALATGKMLSGDSTRFLLALMTDRPDAARGLAQGLPAGSTFSSAGSSSHT